VALSPEEKEIIDAQFEQDVLALVVAWKAAEEALTRLATDPQLIALSAGLDDAAADLRRIELMRAADRELNRMIVATDTWGQRVMASEVYAGTTSALKEIAEQGASTTLIGALGGANTRSISVLVQELRDDARSVADSSRRVLRRHLRSTQQEIVSEAAINATLLAGEVAGRDVRQRAAAVATLFSTKAANGQFVQINGRFFKPSTYGDIIARTRMIEASVQGQINATVASGFDLVRVSDHGKTDKFCDPFAGKVYSLSGDHSRFPPLKERPPFHPRCRHILTPFIEEFKTPDELAYAIARTEDRVAPGVPIQEFLNDR